MTIPVDMRGMFGGAVEATGRAYISALEKVKNEEREQAAKAILDQLNSVGKEHASTIQEPIPDPPVPNPDDDDDKPGPVPPVPPPVRLSPGGLWIPLRARVGVVAGNGCGLAECRV